MVAPLELEKSKMLNTEQILQSNNTQVVPKLQTRCNLCLQAVDMIVFALCLYQVLGTTIGGIGLFKGCPSKSDTVMI